ncbi:MAG TPA: pantoate--beta-alanine ligase [Flavobacterium sp.]|jgi:pantoate--beta-alanine ligase
MLIFNKQADISAHLQKASAGKSVGFVPTMGALHEGHLSLLRKSMEENGLTVISIFVNPTQFNNAEDLEKYPRTLEADVEKIKALSQEIIVFAPNVENIYAGKTESQHFDFDGLEDQMEGRFREGHFNGVATIVKRFFEIIKPDNAYFGEKDFQQLQIVRKMVKKHGLAVNVIGCPVFREPNGLAMSSRNERLSRNQRQLAAIIYKTLETARIKFRTESAKQVADLVEKVFQENSGFRLEYFQIADEDTLKPVTRKLKNKKYRAFIAVFADKVRLIDTIALN